MPLPDAELHARGAAQFTGDLTDHEGTLFVYPVVSSIAHGAIEKIDTAPALACGGVSCSMGIKHSLMKAREI